MTKISLYVECKSITISPNGYNKVTIDADEIELDEVLDYIDEKDEIFKHLIGCDPAEFVEDAELDNFLECFDCEKIAKHLEGRGWSMKDESDC